MAFPRAGHDRDNGRPENHQRPKHDKRGQPSAAMQSGQKRSWPVPRRHPQHFSPGTANRHHHPRAGSL